MYLWSLGRLRRLCGSRECRAEMKRGESGRFLHVLLIRIRSTNDDVQ